MELNTFVFDGLVNPGEGNESSGKEKRLKQVLS